MRKKFKFWTSFVNNGSFISLTFCRFTGFLYAIKDSLGFFLKFVYWMIKTVWIVIRYVAFNLDQPTFKSWILIMFCEHAKAVNVDNNLSVMFRHSYTAKVHLLVTKIMFNSSRSYIHVHMWSKNMKTSLKKIFMSWRRVNVRIVVY